MTESKELTETKKWIISLEMAILFVIVASPWLYMMVNSITKRIGLNILNDRGCPNMYGLVLHAIVFGLLTRLLMLIPI